MAPPQVDASELTALSVASTDGVADAMGRLRPHLGADRWVGPRNRYVKDTIQQLRADSKATGKLWSRQLGEYVAASAPTHCLDGWTFLGKALHAALTGDPDTARHLGYYAELRAATSLLACGGIGIFSDRHFAVDVAGAVHRIKCQGNRTVGTHLASWLYLEHWAGTADASDLLGQVIKAGGVTAEEWVTSMAPGVSWPPLGGWLLQSFGLDLQHLVEDREARNSASYRPTTLRPHEVLGPVEVTAFTAGLWSLMEPTNFASLDREFVSRILAQVFQSLTGKPPHKDLPAFRTMLEPALVSALAGEPVISAYRDRFASDAASPGSGLLGEALGRRPMSDERHHLGVLSRACCLLRLATGATRVVMGRAGVVLSDADFWWRGVGHRRGLWTEAESSVDLVDQWQDVSDALRDLAEYVSSVDESFTLGELAKEAPRTLLTLGRLEVVPFWDLAS